MRERKRRKDKQRWCKIDRLCGKCNHVTILWLSSTIITSQQTKTNRSPFHNHGKTKIWRKIELRALGHRQTSTSAAAILHSQATYRWGQQMNKSQFKQWKMQRWGASNKSLKAHSGVLNKVRSGKDTRAFPPNRSCYDKKTLKKLSR